VRRSLVAGVAIAIAVCLLAAATTAYFVWVRPHEQRLLAVERRVQDLRDRLPRRWAVAPGIDEAGEGNLVPTEAELARLDELLGQPMRNISATANADTVAAWKHMGDRPPHVLVRAIRERPDLSDALDALAVGDFGQATDATGDRLDEAILWMVARAWADDESCLESAVDAIRVAQAIQPVDREIERTVRGWFAASEREALFTIEARWVRCSSAADTDLRGQAHEALERLVAEQPFPVARDFLLPHDRSLNDLRDRWEYDWPVASEYWEDSVSHVEHSLDRVEPYFDYDGPFDEVYDHVPIPPNEPAPLGWFQSQRQIQAQSALLRAVLRHHSGDPVEDLRFHDHSIEMRDEPARLFLHEDSLAGCETKRDPFVTLDLEVLDADDRRWTEDPAATAP